MTTKEAIPLQSPHTKEDARALVTHGLMKTNDQHLESEFGSIASEKRQRLLPYMFRLRRALTEPGAVPFVATFRSAEVPMASAIQPRSMESFDNIHGLFLAEFGHRQLSVAHAVEEPARLQVGSLGRFILERNGEIGHNGSAAVTYELHEVDLDEYTAAQHQLVPELSHMILSHWVDFLYATRG
ncbi:MAG: hypothetical protein JWN38_288 [Candidatus Saccharibacteria bacterium]|nr:hypothetical protein [Candidatus Saccharibacteria bacterium]